MYIRRKDKKANEIAMKTPILMPKRTTLNPKLADRKENGVRGIKEGRHEKTLAKSFGSIVGIIGTLQESVCCSWPLKIEDDYLMGQVGG